MKKVNESFRKVKKPKASIIAGKKKRSERLPPQPPRSDPQKGKESERNKKKDNEDIKTEEPAAPNREEEEDCGEDAKGLPVPKWFTGKSDPQKQAFEKFAKHIFSQGVDGLLKEYNEQLKNYLGQPAARVIFDKNMTKNRYKDVICNDLTRVEIKDGKPGDYIHANFVRGDPLFNEYICTQGPILATRDDFWRMIVYMKTERIVMLCEVVENGKVKCDQYWPANKGEKMTFGDIVVENVTTLNARGTKSITITKLNVTYKSTSLTVCHHHWKTWPDRSIPKSTKDVLRVLRSIRFANTPAVIHCSAGIGRTGTLVAIEMGIQSILSSGNLNMIAVCKRLRDQRMGVLQVDVQFVYMAMAVIDFGMSMGYLGGKSFRENPFYDSFKDFHKALNAVIAVRMAEAANPPAGGGSKDACQPEKPCAKGDCPKPLAAVGSDNQIKAALRTQDEKTKEHK